MPSIKDLLAKTAGKLTEDTRQNQNQNRSRGTSQQGGSGRTGRNLSDLFGGAAKQVKTVPRADEGRPRTPQSVTGNRPSFSWPASQKASRSESKVTPASHYEALEKGTAPTAPGFAMPWYDRLAGVDVAYADEGGGEAQESTAPKTEATGGDFQAGPQTTMSNTYDNANRDLGSAKETAAASWGIVKDAVENSPQAPEQNPAPKETPKTAAKKLRGGLDVVSDRAAGRTPSFQDFTQSREDFIRNSADPQAAKREEEFERVKELKEMYDQYMNWYDTMGYDDYYDDAFVKEMWRQRYNPRMGQDTEVAVMDKLGWLDGLDPGSLSFEELEERAKALDNDSYRKLSEDTARSDQAMRRVYENQVESLYGAGSETTNGSVYIDDDGQVVVLDANGDPMDPNNPATAADYIMELDMALAGYNDPANYTFDSYADAQTSGNLVPFERWVENPYTDQFYVPAYYDPDYSWASDDTTHMLGRDLDTMGLLNDLAYSDADYTDLDPYNLSDHELMMRYGSSAGGIHGLNKELVEDYGYGFGLGSDDPNANPLLLGYLQNNLDTNGLLTAWTNLLTMNRMLGRGGSERGPARQNVFGWDQSIYDMLFGDNLMTQGGGIVKFTPREKGDIDWGIQGELKGQPYRYSDYNPDQLFSDEFMSDNMIWNTGLSNPYLQTRENYIDNGLGALGFDDDLYNLLEFENDNDIRRMSKDDYAAYRNAVYGDESGSETASIESTTPDEGSGEDTAASVLKAITSTKPRNPSTVR